MSAEANSEVSDAQNETQHHGQEDSTTITLEEMMEVETQVLPSSSQEPDQTSDCPEIPLLSVTNPTPTTTTSSSEDHHHNLVNIKQEVLTTSSQVVSPAAPAPSQPKLPRQTPQIKNKPKPSGAAGVGRISEDPSTCLICGNKPYYNYSSKLHAGRGSRTWATWRTSCGKSLCSLLSLPPEPFSTILGSGPYCAACSTLVWDIHFTLNQVYGLEARLERMQMKLEDKIGTHYKELQRKVGHGKLPKTASQKTRHENIKFRAVELIVEEILKRPMNNPRTHNSKLRTSETTSNITTKQVGSTPTMKRQVDNEDSQFTLPTTLLKSVKREATELVVEPFSLRPPRKIVPPVRYGDGVTDRSMMQSWDQTNLTALEEGLEEGEEYVDMIVADACPEDWLSDEMSNVDEIERKPKRKFKPEFSRKMKRILGEKGKVKKEIGKKKPPPIRQESTCDLCQEVCISRRNLEDHIRAKHPGLRFYCKVCPRSYRLESSLMAHTKTLHGDKKYIYHCSTCQKGCVTQEELTEHELIHSSSVTPFICSICAQIFTNSKDLERHVRSHENPFQCGQCHRSYANEEDLSEHIKFHARSVQCDICGLSCFSESRLKQHVTSHSSEKRFQCDLCHLSYKYMKGLRVHIRTHTGERPFVCKICGKTFYDSGHLKKHEEIHAGAKTYVCCVCGKAFMARQNLKQHEMIHDKTKPKKKRPPRSRKPKTPKIQFTITTNDNEHELGGPNVFGLSLGQTVGADGVGDGGSTAGGFKPQTISITNSETNLTEEVLLLGEHDSQQIFEGVGSICVDPPGGVWRPVTSRSTEAQ